MQKILSLILIGAALVFSPVAKSAEIDYGYVTKTNWGTTSAQVIFPANNSSQIRLLSLEVTNDVASSLKIYGGTFQTRCTNAALTSDTNFFASSASSFASNDIVVIQKNLTNSTALYTNQVWGTTASNIIMIGAFGVAITTNDILYKMGAVEITSLGTGLARMDNGGALFASQLRMPLLVQLSGATAAARINRATAKFEVNP